MLILILKKKKIISLGVSINKIKVIYPAVDSMNLDYKKDKSFLKKYKKYAPILLTIARLEKRKNHKQIIFAVKDLIKDFKNLLYLVAGDGPELKQICKTIDKLNLKKNVKILGNVSEKDKASLYKLSDLHIMPTIKDMKSLSIEGFGISYIEAAMFGIPSVSSGLGGTKESIVNGKTGIICNPNNVSSITNSIKKVLINKKNMSANCKRFSQRFLWKNVILNYLKLIKKDFKK